MAEQKDPNAQKDESPASIDPNAILAGVANVVNSALDVGAALARTVAQATAGSNRIPEPAPNASAIDEVLHYGRVVVGNVIRVVLPGAGGTAPEQQAASAAARTPDAARATESPRVHAGATLRVPLSIENPGAEPMAEMHFACLAMTRTPGSGPASGAPLGVDAVRFQPLPLTVGPRDFEKLTVFVDTRSDSAPGRYEMTIGLPGGGFQMAIPFEVIPEEG